MQADRSLPSKWCSRASRVGLERRQGTGYVADSACTCNEEESRGSTRSECEALIEAPEQQSRMKIVYLQRAAWEP